MSAAQRADGEARGRLYRMLWRWHFYAGLFCIPFVVALALTGAVYLFRTEIEAFIDRDLVRLERSGAPRTQDEIVAAALASAPGSTLTAIVLPEHPDDAARVVVSQSGERTRVYVHPDSLAVLKSVAEQDRFSRVVFRLHGELLMGPFGSILVELAASWAIVMVLTGLYLWWPRGARGLAGVLWPRAGRLFVRDLHAVIGVWVSAFALFLLITGLPWSTVWGGAFKEARALTGTAPIQQDWETGSDQSHTHGHAGEFEPLAPHAEDLPIETIVARTQALQLAPPVLLAPPTPQSPYWHAKSEAPNRPLRADVWLSPLTGEVVAREDFSQRHVIDRVVGYGVAAHEGRLFGWANQALGLLTAIGLIVLCVTAFLTWRRRAPAGVLGAPPSIPNARVGYGLGALIIAAAVLLPLLGACLLVIAMLERLVLRRWPAARRWLGLSAPA